MKLQVSSTRLAFTSCDDLGYGETSPAKWQTARWSCYRRSRSLRYCQTVRVRSSPQGRMAMSQRRFVFLLSGAFWLFSGCGTADEPSRDRTGSVGGIGGREQRRKLGCRRRNVGWQRWHERGWWWRCYVRRHWRRNLGRQRRRELRRCRRQRDDGRRRGGRRCRRRRNRRCSRYRRPRQRERTRAPTRRSTHACPTSASPTCRRSMRGRRGGSLTSWGPDKSKTSPPAPRSTCPWSAACTLRCCRKDICKRTSLPHSTWTSTLG